MYQGAWVYPGLKPGYHSSVMNSSTGMTVAIASPRADRDSLHRGCPEGFTAISRWQRARSSLGNADQSRAGTLAGSSGASSPATAGMAASRRLSFDGHQFHRP